MLQGDGDSSITCSDLTFDGVFDGQATDGKLTFSADSQDYIDETYVPGVYEVTITGTAVGSSPLQEKSATFLLTLLDPCDPPASVTGVDFVNQDYTLTDIERSYTHPVFTISPDYCEFRYSFTQTLLQAGDSAITQYNSDETKFFYHYEKDLLPLGQI